MHSVDDYNHDAAITMKMLIIARTTFPIMKSITQMTTAIMVPVEITLAIMITIISYLTIVE